MIIIRESTIKDADQLAACVDSVAREKKYLASQKGFTIEQTSQFIRSLMDSGGIQLLCMDNEKIVGWCDILPGSFKGLQHCGQLGMGLIKEYRGYGLGKQILTETISQAFKKNFKRIELEVFASNKAAIALYEKSGFVKEGCKRQARKLDGQYDDILIYGLLKDEWRLC